MAKYKFTAELSAKGIRSLRNEISKYKTDILPYKVEMLSKRLAEHGVEFAKTRITTLDAIFTGELLNSIRMEKTGNSVFVIVADSKHAAYVEFGTGQLGAEAPYPGELPDGIDWNYNTGKTIFEISPGQYGWFFPMPDGTWRFTQGMPSRPFMYETWLELYSTVEKIAKEVFR